MQDMTRSEILRSAAAKTREVITRRKWWGAVLFFSAVMVIFAAAAPTVLLIRTGMMRDLGSELSLADGSLLRLLLPALAVVIIFIGCAVLAQFLVEAIRIQRRQ